MLIKNGLVVLKDSETVCDILCDGEKIVQIGKNLAVQDMETIDACGKIVIPGGVDVHTHLNLDAGIAVASDDFYTGTVAAACGGTTTIVDHPAFGPAGCSPDHQIIKYHELAKGRAVIDYGFHGVLQHVDNNVLVMMETLADEGITSFKLYLTYGFMLSDSDVFKVLRRAKELGLVIAVHAENDGVIKLLREEYTAAGKVSAGYHPLTRPPECEAEAVGRMVMLARLAGKNSEAGTESGDASLYIVHLSSALGLEIINAAKRRGQKNLWAETCPQYLFLKDSLYRQPEGEGFKYLMCPPLRKTADNAALWQGLASDIDTIGTDHCPFFFKTQKLMCKNDFTKCPSGAPGIEERIPLMYNAVSEGRLSLRRFTDLCCTNPARIFGLYPQKGVLAPGSDADITIIDPERHTVISQKNLHSNVDYSAYEGFSVKGWPEITISRGEIIVKNGMFVGKAGRGRFLKRGRVMTND